MRHKLCLTCLTRLSGKHFSNVWCDFLLWHYLTYDINLASDNRSPISEVINIKISYNHALIFSWSLSLPSCARHTSPTMHRWDDPWLTSGTGCELGVPVRPVLLNASWQVVCETLVFCLFLPPRPCWQCPHCEYEGLCFVLPASLQPVLVRRELAHTSAISVGTSVDLPAHCLTFYAYWLTFPWCMGALTSSSYHFV